MLFVMGWRKIQSWLGVSIADESSQSIAPDMTENLRQIEQRYFLERRSLL